MFESRTGTDLISNVHKDARVTESTRPVFRVRSTSRPPVEHFGFIRVDFVLVSVLIDAYTLVVARLTSVNELVSDRGIRQS